MRTSVIGSLRSTRRLAVPSSRSFSQTSRTSNSNEFNVSEAKQGVKVASAQSEDGQTGAISLIIRAGSRFEQGPGQAHILKNFLLKGTKKRSALRLIRESELMGGVLSTSLTREHIILTAEFLKGDEGYFAELLGDAITQANFAPHEYNEDVLPQVASEYEQAIRSADTYAFDLAHQLAFRTGLGNSLFASPHSPVDYDSALEFASKTLTPANIAVVASGVESNQLQSFVSEFFVRPGASSGSLSSPKAQYYGGELRVPSVAHDATNDQLLVAFKGASRSHPAYAVLRHLLGGESALKWAQGASPFSKIVGDNASTASVKAFNLGYTDAGLVGFTVSAPTSHVESLASKAVQELKNVAKGGLKQEDVKRAIAGAKFAAAAAVESRLSKLEQFGSSLLEGQESKHESLDKLFAQLDKVTGDEVAKAAKAAVESKATTVAIGNTHKLPYADSIGL